ncbi:MAG: PorP/SprF family type IX secretion system membrane protein [Bacteroidetes bacterium]|nr:PorP/SprF family type IX secretion system membrane protein [Bacteroidota bacterium]
MKKLLIYILLFCGYSLSAQDFHISQYDVLTLYNNPALTGVFHDEQQVDYKYYLTHRSQWKSIGIKPFKTYSLAYDMKYKRFGIGALLLNNRSGLGNFNTLNFLVSGSYFIIKDPNSPHVLTTGIQIGLLNKSFDPQQYLYESQYNASTGMLDEGIVSGESYAHTSILKFDANLGIYYSYNEKEKKYHPFVGFSIYHITKPNESFTSTKSKMPMRFNFNPGCEFIVSDKVKLIPSILYMNQAKASEFNIGALGTYRIKEKNDIIYGINYRWKDALIIHAGFRKDNILFRMSYDVNTSYLYAYTGNRGAFELSLVVSGKKGENPFKSIKSF